MLLNNKRYISLSNNKGATCYIIVKKSTAQQLPFGTLKAAMSCDKILQSYLVPVKHSRNHEITQ